MYSQVSSARQTSCSLSGKSCTPVRFVRTQPQPPWWLFTTANVALLSSPIALALACVQWHALHEIEIINRC
jgi:hypothetical protein